MFPKFQLAAALLATTCAAQAQVSATGFGTIGYTVSDRPYSYQRFVDNAGTFNRDSVLGLQIDARINEQFSFVVQGKLSPSTKNDSGWDPTLTWAFLAWRPDNDLLLRLGKVRVPFYLNSANLDVGVTYDPAQLPPELYSISPTNETNGFSFSKNWAASDTDINLDGYWGVSNSYWRFHVRDDLTALGGPPANNVFVPTRIDSKGLALTLTRNENTLRFGYHRASVSKRDGTQFRPDFSFIPVGMGQGYYTVDGSGKSHEELLFNIFTLAFDLGLAHDIRLIGEYARRINQTAPQGGPDTHSGYLSLQKKIGPWNPYVTVSRLVSTDRSLDLYEAVNTNRVTSPPVPPATTVLINASQRIAADRLVVYDQGTLAIGTSYLLSPTQKIKAEWAVTRVGKVSNFIDTPSGKDIAHQNISVFSLSYNFTF